MQTAQSGEWVTDDSDDNDDDDLVRKRGPVCAGRGFADRCSLMQGHVGQDSLSTMIRKDELGPTRNRRSIRP